MIVKRFYTSYFSYCNCIKPAANIANMVLVVTEKILVSSLLCVLSLTNAVGNALHVAGIA